MIDFKDNKRISLAPMIDWVGNYHKIMIFK